jgi:hypothetical protein
MKSQSFGNRAIQREQRLAWDVLVSLYGGEEPLKAAIDDTRGLAASVPTYVDTLTLADKYLSGWRPKDFGDDDEEED